ncbi:transketolase family protein [Pseudomonas rhizoryzae]|uniref:transketolase family protein n=1 Tax=Pseudomonas rhizoryzae TaxID=2571129 RepID=UPI0007365711|nr:transketolase C-terminal domain-containing protein [Pseudomonas rhizoryzae]APQ10269.1 transketolase [Pseudomonas psychrotolerans]KTT37806.1 transketolase [Pseudomonas psychrotolerans]KTT76469.1 transketolase [Pseudomonas psychrotolerans]
MSVDTLNKPRLTTSAMIASIASEGQRTEAAPFGQALVAAAAQDQRIVGMTADLSKYTDLHVFAREFPERHLQMGMAEQLLMAAAGGLAKEGLVPFATTYAVFATRRAYDFIHQVIAEENLNVKICAALPGLTTGYGPSHQATDDLALMRAVPGLTVIDPCDALDTAQAVAAIAAYQGPVYMRLLRGKVPLILDQYDYRFELGKAKLLRDGRDVLIVSSGIMTMRALEVAEAMSDGSADVAVLHVPTIKPLDEATLIEQCRRSGRLVVVAENHSTVGGLSEAVALTLLRARVHPEFRQIALPDQFLDAGALPTLHERYGISTAAMVASIQGWLS